MDGLDADGPITFSGRDLELRGIKLSMKLAPHERVVQCPYDPLHIVLTTRYGRHILKCRLNYMKNQEKKQLKVEYAPCKYNYTHIHVAMELEYHQHSCPDRFNPRRNDPVVSFAGPSRLVHSVDPNDPTKTHTYMAPARPASSVKYEKKKVEDKEEPEEDWEEELRTNPTPFYDPIGRLAAVNFRYFNPIGLTKSERKGFRKLVHAAAGYPDEEPVRPGQGTPEPKPEPDQEPEEEESEEEDEEDENGLIWVEY